MITLLCDKEIKYLILNHNMIEDYTDLETQLQPNGFDLCIDKVFRFVGRGRIDFSNKNRKIADVQEMPPDSEGKWSFGRGTYKIRMKETTNIPDNIRAIARPRSTLIRNGATVETGVWDSGYHGKSESLLLIENDRGIIIEKGARVIQLIFFTGEIPETIYQGKFNNEHI